MLLEAMQSKTSLEQKLQSVSVGPLPDTPDQSRAQNAQAVKVYLSFHTRVVV
jgi:hypothetical protein